jgi:hypothetical protein
VSNSDPRLVKAGDTVTVRFIETGDVVTTKAYKPSDIKPAGWVSVLGWPLNKGDGTHGLAVKYFEIIDHQPARAPDPERDRLSDVIFEAVRDQPYSYADGADQAAASVRAAFVVIDPTPVLRADIEAAGRRLVAAHAMQPHDENVDVFVAQVYAALGIEAS